MRQIGRGGLVPTTEMVALFDRLSARGWSNYDIAAAAGLDSSTVSKYRTGARRKIRVATAERILRADYWVQVPGTRVDATGTHRRLRALSAMGWPLTEVARRLDLPASTVGTIAASASVGTTVATRDAVAALYEDLAGTLGPSDLGRLRARKRGWLPPLAWDDIDTDEEPCA